MAGLEPLGVAATDDIDLACSSDVDAVVYTVNSDFRPVESQAEVEAVLHGHRAVEDCAVFGVPAGADGEAIVAAVKLSTAVQPDELAALVSDQLASYKRPSRVVVVDEIPRLPSGKVLRRVLKERLWTSV